MNVSVIIPVHARPELLAEAVRSVLAGDLTPRELIVVVDAMADSDTCPDPHRLAVQRACADRPGPLSCDCRVLVTNRAGAGPAAARNVGIAVARGEWLAFLDSDDLYHPHHLRAQRDYLRTRPHLRGCQSPELWLKNNRELAQPEHLIARPGRFLRDSFRHCLISCSAVLLQRSVFAEIGLFDESFPACEDFELWLRYLERWPMGLVPEPSVTKRSGDWPQLSARFHSMDRLRVRAILMRVRAGALNKPERSAARAACHEKLAILRRGARRHGGAAALNALELDIERAFSEKDATRG